MTQKEKELLLKYLCMALPYGVICEDMEGKTRPLFGVTPTQHFIVTLDNATDGTNGLKFCTIDCIKPYLRPMSSMTKEEREEMYNLLSPEGTAIYGNDGIALPLNHCGKFVPYEFMNRIIQYLLKYHFDFMGLIPKCLAIEITESNNPYKE